MKVIVIVTLVVSIFAILSCSDGRDNSESETSSSNIIVPTQDLATLNPAHGEPGHRCDIAVGQPLSSKPATQPSTVFNPVTTAPTPSTKPTTIFTPPVFNPNVKTVTNPAINFTPPTLPIAGLNPPHGQPGHRCDIKVGQPLNSKPASTTNTTPTTNPLTISSPIITPTTNATTVAPGMNPKHGQPGHRCDIPVGQPLNSKPSR